MLILPVPDTRQCDEGRRDGALPKSEQEAHGSEASKICRGCETQADGSPDDAVTTSERAEK
jgi:hypothetical protein